MSSTSIDLGFAQVDVQREARQGLPEVVYGPGKTTAQIESIVRTLLASNTGPVLVTRVDAEPAADLVAVVPAGRYDDAARLQAADAVIVVAGMEGALASAVGGLVAAPVIAVPTSTGYGAALDGVTALLAMLTSCAAGITVVNIDSGFSAAMAAHRLLAHRMSQVGVRR